MLAIDCRARFFYAYVPRFAVADAEHINRSRRCRRRQPRRRPSRQNTDRAVLPDATESRQIISPVESCDEFDGDTAARKPILLSRFSLSLRLSPPTENNTPAA